jgi:hypothetical protein
VRRPATRRRGRRNDQKKNATESQGCGVENPRACHVCRRPATVLFRPTRRLRCSPHPWPRVGVGALRSPLPAASAHPLHCTEPGDASSVARPFPHTERIARPSNRTKPIKNAQHVLKFRMPDVYTSPFYSSQSDSLYLTHHQDKIKA